MSPQALLTTLLLPPTLFVLLLLPAAALAWRRGARLAGGVTALAALGLLALATPLVEGTLLSALEREAARWPRPAAPPGAIVVLGGDLTRSGPPGRAAPEPGPLTLERLRAGAALHRATGLPILVTGGPFRRGEPAIAEVMADSLRRDFGVPVRWVERAAADTRGHARLAPPILRADGVAAAFVVSHGWHLPRAAEAFAREGFPVAPAPLRVGAAPDGTTLSDWVPRPDHWGGSWLGLREWAGRLVYALRDAAPPRPIDGSH